MDAALLSALSALAGSVVGGLTSGFTNWLNQRAQTKASLLAHVLSRREELFKDLVPRRKLWVVQSNIESHAAVGATT